MKFGVFGCRHFHLELAVQEMLQLGHECIGVYETQGALAKKLADQYGLKMLASEKEFFDAAPEIALCSSVNGEKAAQIETCCKRGVPIMLDKPLVASRAEFDRVLRVQEETGTEIGLMLTERFNPPVVRLKEIVSSGVLGEVVGMLFSKPHKLSPSTRESWHFDKAQNGGPVIDLMIHDFDLLHWISQSKTTETVGFLKKGDREGYPDFYDDAKVLAKTESGVTASLLADWWTPDGYPCFGNEKIVCSGTKGRCEVFCTGEPTFHPEGFCLLSTKDTPEEVLEGLAPKRGLMEDFLERIAHRPSVITWEDIVSATEATLLADESAKVLA